MMHDDLNEEIKKLKYHISILAQTVDYQSYPVESLILSMDWTQDELNDAHDIFDKWDKVLRSGGKITPSEFEWDFKEKFNLSYQSVKSVVNAFYKNDQWTNVCEAFVDGMGPHPSVEYLGIANREK